MYSDFLSYCKFAQSGWRQSTARKRAINDDHTSKAQRCYWMQVPDIQIPSVQYHFSSTKLGIVLQWYQIPTSLSTKRARAGVTHKIRTNLIDGYASLPCPLSLASVRACLRSQCKLNSKPRSRSQTNVQLNYTGPPYSPEEYYFEFDLRNNSDISSLKTAS